MCNHSYLDANVLMSYFAYAPLDRSESNYTDSESIDLSQGYRVDWRFGFRWFGIVLQGNAANSKWRNLRRTSLRAPAKCHH